MVELAETFSLEKVHKAGAIFDIEKLDWFNWQWQKRLYNEKLASLAKEIDENVQITNPKKGEFKYEFSDKEAEEVFYIKRTDELKTVCDKYVHEDMKKDGNKYRKAILTIEEKILKEPEKTEDFIKFYFSEKDYNVTLLTHEKMKVDYPTAKKALKNAYNKLEKLGNFDSQTEIQNMLMEAINELQLKNGQVLWPVRAALTGEEFSPGVFEVAFVLEKEESLKRLKKALEKLEKET